MANNHNRHLILTDQNFRTEVLQDPKPVLVDFWAPWCGPCQVMNPIFTELADEYEGRIRVGKVNVDEQPEVSARYGIRSIPTLLLFKNGQVVERIIGAMSKRLLVEKMGELLRVA
jgi:thioredoxin 1